jgi:copper resistance protein C
VRRPVPGPAPRPTGQQYRPGPTTAVRRARVALALTVALAASVLAPGVAHAHDELLGSDPSDGAVLDEAPAEVVLTFSADQLQVGAAVQVLDPAGTDRASGAPVVQGTTVRQALAGLDQDGEYRVDWRSVSNDGHPITGSFTFALEGVAESVEPGGPGDTPTDPVPGLDLGEDGSPSPLLVVGFAVAVLAAAGTVLALVRRGGLR